jgi:hypothetical protein
MSIIQKVKQILLSFLEAIQSLVQYILAPVIRIFRATDDQYPETGVQPFEGEPFDKKNPHHKELR